MPDRDLGQWDESRKSWVRATPTDAIDPVTKINCTGNITLSNLAPMLKYEELGGSPSNYRAGVDAGVYFLDFDEDADGEFTPYTRVKFVGGANSMIIEPEVNGELHLGTAAKSIGTIFAGDTTVDNLITAGNVDGRDVSVDGTKLDGIEVAADVTDDANVRAALAAATAKIDVNDKNLADVGRINVKVIRASFGEDVRYDNYNPAGLDDASILLLSPHASGNSITGITAPTANKDGRLLWVVNADRLTGGNLTLKDTDANSDAANRLQLPNSADCVLGYGDAIELFYDDTSDRWRALDR